MVLKDQWLIIVVFLDDYNDENRLEVYVVYLDLFSHCYRFSWLIVIVIDLHTYQLNGVYTPTYSYDDEKYLGFE